MLALIGAALISLLSGGHPDVRADDIPPTPSDIFATGLLNPRGLTFGPDGYLYVAEAGAAGETKVEAGLAHLPYRIGQTARVTRISPAGELETIVGNLPSVASPDAIYGAANVAFVDDTLYVLTAAGGRDVGDPAFDNAILRVGPGPDHSVSQVFDLTQMNLQDPPLARREDPRADVEGGVPYGLTAFNGKLYATDANLETVTEIGLDGSYRRFVELPASNRVLIALVPAPDVSLWLAEYGPSPHQPNSSKIDRLTLDGELSPAWTGLDETIGIAFGPDGSAYALTFANKARATDAGSLYRRSPDGQVTSILTDLNFPTGLAIGPDGNAYIAENGNKSEDGSGRIIRVTLPTS
jgi:DNA-binding beta-propeller fold protein YncE